MELTLEVPNNPVGPDLPEPSAPSEPVPDQGPEVPSPDPRGPETPDQPTEPDLPVTEPATGGAPGPALAAT